MPYNASHHTRDPNPFPNADVGTSTQIKAPDQQPVAAVEKKIKAPDQQPVAAVPVVVGQSMPCLLYTSDAADE